MDRLGDVLYNTSKIILQQAYLWFTPPDIIILWFILQGTPDLSHATFETLGTGVCLIEK